MRGSAVIFQTFGGFSIHLDDYGNVPDDLGDFWTEVEQEKGWAKQRHVFGQDERKSIDFPRGMLEDF
jgi:hypothetical protein